MGVLTRNHIELATVFRLAYYLGVVLNEQSRESDTLRIGGL